MKKFALILISGILLNFIAPAFAAMPVTAYASEDNAVFQLSAEDADYLRSIRDMPVSLAITSELTSFVNVNGEKSGMLQPLIGLLEDQWGLTVETVNVGLEEGFQKLNSGEVDMLGFSILNEARQQLYDHTDAIFNPHMDIYTHKDTPMDSVVDLSGQTLGFLSDSVLPEMLEVYLTPEGSAKYYKTIDELIMALERGEIFCIATTLMIQSELLGHLDINYKISVESVAAPQCVYSNNDRLTPLIDLINRYLRSREGGRLIAEISANRRKCTMERIGAFFKDDIEYIKTHYDKLRIFDNGMMYPLSYVQNGGYRGLQEEIYTVMQELTGVPVEIVDFPESNGVKYSVPDSLKKGEIIAATGIYRSNEFDLDPAFEHSVPITMDILSFYVKQNNTISSLSDMRIGSHDFSRAYFRWNIAGDKTPELYSSLSVMMGDLQSGKLDAVFIGEMMTDYYYTVLNDYTLKRFDNLTVPANVHILYNTENESFNRLMNAAIKMQMATTPANRQAWNGRSQNSKFEMIWLRSQMDTFRSRSFVTAILFMIALAVLLVFVMYQLMKFSNFDKQVSRMLTAQGNADMLWGNLNTGQIISKGNHPISSKLGFSKRITDSLVDIVSIQQDLDTIDAQELAYYMRDIEVETVDKGSVYYFRRFTHKISESEFMVYIMDFTAEKYREQELSELANTDHLTKLLNRRAMDELLSRKTEEFALCENKIFVFMMDIDNFKKINDSYGHNVGDRVLVVLARVIEAHMPCGNVSRWGGEEFLCVAELESREKALELARNILYEFESSEITIGKEKSFASTISCGVSELLDGEAYMNAVTRADKALYQAKCEGKNCVRFQGADAVPCAAPEVTDTIGVSVTYDRVMSRVLQAFFHIRSIDAVIMEMLKVVTVYNSLDRAYVFEKNDKGIFERTYVYDPPKLGQAGPTVTITEEEIIRFSDSIFPKPRFVSDVSIKVSEEELHVRAKGLKSFAQLPIFAGGELVGMVGFDNCRETHEWTNEEQHVLSDTATILGEFVIRKELERRLMISNNAMTSILESIDDYVYVAEFETQKLLFANKKARTIFDESYINVKTCWQVVRPDLEGPCEYCMHKDLVDENGVPTGKTVRHDVYNPIMKVWFEVTYTLIEWEAGQRAAVMVCRDITAHKNEDLRLEKTLDMFKEKSAVLDFAFQSSRSFLWMISTDLITLHLSETVENTLGYPAAYFEKSFEKYKKIMGEEDIPGTILALQKYLNGESPAFSHEYRVRTADGTIKWLLVRGEISQEDTSKVCGVAMDITERKSLEETRESLLQDLQQEREKQKHLLEILQSQEVQTTLALEGANSYSWEYTPEPDKLVLSKTAEQALGYPLEYFEQKSTKYTDCIVFSFAPEAIGLMNDYVAGKTEMYAAEYPIITASGEIKWYLTRGKYADSNREIIYGVCIDITESKKHEQMLAERAYRDPLTGLYNKQYILDGLVKPLKKKFKNFGGVLLDVRSFKNINEAFGYSYGDKIIENVAGRLCDIFSGKQIIRTSGNRFLAVFENANIEVLEVHAQQVAEEFKKPILVDDQMISVDFKIGIAVSNDTEVTKLLKDTEIALYSAKESLTKAYRVLDDDIRMAFKKKVNMEFELRNAIEKQEFVLQYQPTMFAATKRVAGAEALIRWNHPQLGLVPPLDFIPLAESTGLIIPIGEFVIKEVAKQIGQWLAEGADIFMSFNLSAKQFLSPQLISVMRETLEKYKIPENRLAVEITESAMISDLEYVNEVLQEFKSFGVGVSLDDFGTGYSSLHYLSKIPLDYLKIDKSFIEDVTTKSRDSAILESILTMSRNLGFRVTAEGVETAEQFALLEKLGCDIIQGYYLSKPLSKEDFEAFMEASKDGVVLE